MSITVPSAPVVAVLAIVLLLIVVLWVLVAMLRHQNDEADLDDDDARADSVIAALAKAERDISHRPRVKRAAGLPFVERQP